MTANKDVKKLVRARQAKTGESYSTARMHVLGDRAEILAPSTAMPARQEAIVLTVGRGSALVRVAGDERPVTLRSPEVSAMALVPGHIVTLAVDKRWTWRGEACASGRIERVRMDVPSLGLEPLPLEGGELEDLRDHSDAPETEDAYARLWKKLTAKPRPSYEFHEIAWGQLPGIDADAEDNPTCQASEYVSMGMRREARELLMGALAQDLRVLDAHAHLGNLEFDKHPERAVLHYEMGMRIGELSLPKGVDVLLSWGMLYNRPFLRCLHGYGLCLWRAGDFDGARRVFERMIALNPDDNQGARFCWHDVRAGLSWEEMNKREEEAERRAARRRRLAN